MVLGDSLRITRNGSLDRAPAITEADGSVKMGAYPDSVIYGV